jgi:hypothetical protein
MHHASTVRRLLRVAPGRSPGVLLLRNSRTLEPGKRLRGDVAQVPAIINVGFEGWYTRLWISRLFHVTRGIIPWLSG